MDNMDIIRKGKHLNNLKKYNIFLISKQNSQMNDTNTDYNNLIFKTLYLFPKPAVPTMKIKILQLLYSSNTCYTLHHRTCIKTKSYHPTRHMTILMYIKILMQFSPCFAFLLIYLFYCVYAFLMFLPYGINK
jgi:hypothetical protein